MFSLTAEDLGRSILGCGDGPASFNSELTARGGKIVSVDPLYECNSDQIAARIDQCFGRVMEETRKHADEFVWSHVRSVDELGEIRMGAMRSFLSDYPAGRSQGRYLADALPSLSFADNSFDLGLCSHFLFLYSQHFDLAFHIESIAEMCRVCREVRIFPLLQLGSRPSQHLDSACRYFRARGFEVDPVEVPYEFQRGGNTMLRIKRSARSAEDRT